MTGIVFTRAEERRMRKLADRTKPARESDRRFFERFSHRKFRVRLMHQAEIEQNAILLGEGSMKLPPTHALYMVVKNVAPGARMRLTIVGPRGADTDLSEDDARRLYEIVDNEAARELEAALLADLAAGGA